MSYGDNVAQLTYLLFLKMADEKFDYYRHTLEALCNQKSPLGLIFNKSQNIFHISA